MKIKMRTAKLMILAGLTLAVMSFTTDRILDGIYEVDKMESQIIWNGKKVTGEHFGTVQIKSGNIKVAKGKLKGGDFIIDMSTITSTDLQGEYLQKLNAHLKSDDFFGIEKYPTANFKITKVVPENVAGEYTVTGDLTIKAITQPISFIASLSTDDGKIVTTADIVIDRSEFDVRYGSGSFFDNLGDKTIYDDFYMKVKLVTSK